MADVLNNYEPVALGELNLTIEQFGNYTLRQIEALIEGYKRRRYATEDLLIVYSALPIYQSMLGKNAPTYEQLTRHRTSEKRESAVEYWRDYFNRKEQNKC